MLIRLLVILTLALTPVAALADDTSQPTDTPAATDTPNPGTAQGPTSGNYMLGPSSAGSAPNSGGSTGDSVSLQPAGQSPLQSTTSDSTGLTAPTSSVLQAPASSDQALRVLAGEADGTPVQVAANGGPSLGTWLALSVLFGLIVTILSLFYRQIAAVFAPIRKLRPPRGLRRRK